MRTVNVAWDREAERFTALGTHRGSELLTNAPENTPDPSGKHSEPPPQAERTDETAGQATPDNLGKQNNAGKPDQAEKPAPEAATPIETSSRAASARAKKLQ